MPGARPNNPRVGDRAEYYANFLLSRIASAVQVPRQEDFGIDFMGALLRREGQSLREGARFNVQVKSNADLLAKPFGALRTSGWSHHEVKWLLGREPFPMHLSPLFVGVVDLDGGWLDIYTTVNMFHARWMAGNPTEIVLVPGELAEGPPLAYAFGTPLPYEPETLAANPPPGDAQRWLVRLRNPVARLSAQMAAGTDEDLAPVITALERWIHIDQLNRVSAFLRIPAAWYVDAWLPNVAPSGEDVRSTVYGTDRTDADLPHMEDVLHVFLTSLRYNYGIQKDQVGMAAAALLGDLIGARHVARHPRRS
ncbi:MAG: hypothetical protein H6735_06480 [Alphaproteobacteria bacterium]|nr:hypothetical protein [Alphaproteobacteria bacterium]